MDDTNSDSPASTSDASGSGSSSEDASSRYKRCPLLYERIFFSSSPHDIPFLFFFSAKRSRASPFIVTTAEEKKKLSEQWAKVFFAYRLSFNVAENKEFKAAMEMMRPGVGKNLLSRWDLAGTHLTREHDKIDDAMKQDLQVS